MLADWLIAWRNVRRNLRRHLLTGISIACGGAAMILLGGYILRMQTYLLVHSVYTNHKGHIAIFHHEGLDGHLADQRGLSLSADEQKALLAMAAAEPRVEFVGSYLEGVALIANGCNTSPILITGADVDVERRIHQHPLVLHANPELNHMSSGHGFWEAPEDGQAISITREVGELISKPLVATEAVSPEISDLDCDAPDVDRKVAKDASVQLLGESFSGDFAGTAAHIVSHHSTGFALLEDTSVVAPLTLVKQLFETDKVTYQAFYLRDGRDTHEVLASLRDKAAQSGLAVDLYPFDDAKVSQFYVGAMNFVYVMALFFIVLIWGVSCLALINTISMTIIERAAEIGMLRAMGFMPHRVASLLVKECLLVSALSLVIAMALASIESAVVNALNLRFAIAGLAGTLQFKLVISPELLAMVAVSTLIVAAIAAYLTCRFKLRMPIVQLIQTSGR